jgi:hypothetical protein
MSSENWPPYNGIYKNAMTDFGRRPRKTRSFGWK